MAVSPVRNVRVADERWAAWGEAAAVRGVSVAALVHAGVELLLATDERDLVGRSVLRAPWIDTERADDLAPVAAPEGFDPPEVMRVPKRRARTDYCEHRRRPDEYCSRCD